MKIEKPTDRKTYEGEIADYWFEDGVFISLSKSPRLTVENISGNIALVTQIRGNRCVPLSIYLSKSPVSDKETRQFASQQLPRRYFMPTWNG